MAVPAVNPVGHAHVLPKAGFWLQQLLVGQVYAPFAEVPPVAKTPPNVGAAVLASPPPLPELVLVPLLEPVLLPLLEPALVPLLEPALPPLLELVLLPPVLELPPLE
jgi:hypothetical protein